MNPLLALLACPLAETPAPAAPPPSSPGAPVTTHPGTVVFLDPDGARREVPVADVPERVAWYEGGGARTPVVRVETLRRGDALEIKRFGPDDALLDTTVSAPRR